MFFGNIRILSAVLVIYALPSEAFVTRQSSCAGIRVPSTLPVTNSLVQIAYTPTLESLTSRPKYSSSSALEMGLELVDPSYNLAIGAFAVGLAGGFLEDLRDDTGEKLLTAKPFGALALIFTIFSLFLTFQTTTLRFGFDEDSFSLVKADGSSLGDNVVVGGENKWAYSSFKNYDFLPNSDFPILVYFREDATPVQNREEVPIVVDNLEGQVHFFPAIANVQQLKDGFEKNGCSHL
mmetsp:Transcript_19047/g.27479  ORF Transcript_19047/g.27479 Transcript_19047/m.27479 type:complete len:236 (+) Transcript_19047:122-829(+)